MALPKVSLTQKIFIGLAIGVLVGWLWPQWGTAVRPLSMLFLNLIKSIIAPLIFATLVIGIAGTGDIRQVGRIGFKALLYFEIVTTFALFIGLGAVNLTKPGVGVSLAGVHTEENKAVLADRATKLSKESTEAARARRQRHRGGEGIAGRRRGRQRTDRARPAGEAAEIRRHHRPPRARLDYQSDGRGRRAADRRLLACCSRWPSRRSAKKRGRSFSGASRWPTSCFASPSS